MKTFIFRYDGIWPVGACGIVNAPTEEEAFVLASALVAKANGSRKREALTINDLIEWDASTTHAEIILNGEY